MMLQQISKRGREYLKTAETLLRAAQTMTDLFCRFRSRGRLLARCTAYR
jgi:hypothetical protein